jgi:hypothetical protein
MLVHAWVHASSDHSMRTCATEALAKGTGSIDEKTSVYCLLSSRSMVACNTRVSHTYVATSAMKGFILQLLQPLQRCLRFSAVV